MVQILISELVSVFSPILVFLVQFLAPVVGLYAKHGSNLVPLKKIWIFFWIFRFFWRDT